jgi:hypothetical protein
MTEPKIDVQLQIGPFVVLSSILGLESRNEPTIHFEHLTLLKLLDLMFEL